MDAIAFNARLPVTALLRIQDLLGLPPTGKSTQALSDAVRELQEENHLDADGKAGAKTLAVIDALARDDNQDDVDDDEPDPLDSLRSWCSKNEVSVVDYRDLKAWPRDKVYPKEYGYPRNKVRAQPASLTLRPWATITTFMLHTTAVGGMTDKRGLGIPAHLYLPKESAIVLCHEMERRLAHGHAANKFTVGLEISGVSDWDAPSQIVRARALLRYFQSVRRLHVGPEAKCYVMAHRMSHSSRVRDPGKRIWQDAGEWAIEELGFELGPVVGSGTSVDEWRGR